MRANCRTFGLTARYYPGLRDWAHCIPGSDTRASLLPERAASSDGFPGESAWNAVERLFFPG